MRYSGRKYHKIVASDLQTNGERWSQGVHAFVDKNTGEVYKPASLKSPAQYVDLIWELSINVSNYITQDLQIGQVGIYWDNHLFL